MPDNTQIEASPSPRELQEAVARQQLEKDRVGTSDMVTFVFELIMNEVHTGALIPGDRVSDFDIAKRLGISRTPVREAVQKLREMGLVEVAAHRFTRICIIDRDQTAQLLIVFHALYTVLLKEVTGTLDSAVIDGLTTDLGKFRERIADGDQVLIASTGVDFLMRIVAQSHNAPLKKALYSVIHVIKLGSTHIDALVGSATLRTSLDGLLVAGRARDTDQACRALDLLKI